MKEEIEKHSKSSYLCSNSGNQSVGRQLVSLQLRDMEHSITTKPKAEQTEDQLVASDKDSQNSRFAKTVKVFQQTGLLECTLQTAKLIQENEKLQQKIDHLEKETNEATQKARKDLREHLTKLQQNSSSEGRTAAT